MSTIPESTFNWDLVITVVALVASIGFNIYQAIKSRKKINVLVMLYKNLETLPAFSLEFKISVENETNHPVTIRKYIIQAEDNKTEHPIMTTSLPKRLNSHEFWQEPDAIVWIRENIANFYVEDTLGKRWKVKKKLVQKINSDTAFWQAGRK